MFLLCSCWCSGCFYRVKLVVLCSVRSLAARTAQKLPEFLLRAHPSEVRAYYLLAYAWGEAQMEPLDDFPLDEIPA